MEELIILKAELHHIRLTVDRSNPYMSRVIEELTDEPADRLRTYFDEILKKEISEAERDYYRRLIQIL